VFAAAATALRPGGHLVFTVERVEPEVGVDHQIRPHGRYSHAEAYVRRALGAAGMTPVAIEPAYLRIEGSLPVAGLVVTARRNA
jgi:predicted TPR repeat methyltransferase